MRRSFFRRVIDAAIARFGRIANRQRQLRQRRQRQAFLESLEDRRMMTYTSLEVSKSVPFLIDPLTFFTGSFTAKMSNTHPTNSMSVTVDLIGADDAFTAGTPKVTGATVSISSSSNDPPGAGNKSYQYTFTIPADTDAEFTLPVRALVDSDTDDETLNFEVGTDLAVVHEQWLKGSSISIIDGLGLIYRTLQICPGCSCCKGNVQTGASMQNISAFAPPSAGNNMPIAGQGFVGLSLQNDSNRLLPQQLVVDVPVAGGSSAIDTTLKLYHFADLDNNGSFAWESINGPSGYFQNSSDSGTPDYRISMPLTETYTHSGGTRRLDSGWYIVELGVTRSGVADRKRFGVVNIINSEKEYASWGNGWSIANERRLAINDVDGDGTLGDFEAAAAPGVSMFFGGSNVWFPKLLDGTFGSPGGDFRNLTLTYASGEYTVASPEGMKTVFDAKGLILREEDRQGNQRLYTYASGRLDRITEPDGNYVTFGYNGSGKVTTLTDNHSRVTTINRNGTTGAIESFVYPDPDAGGSLLAPRVEFAYNATGQVSSRKLYPTESNSSGAAETDTFTYDSTTHLVDTITYSGGLSDVFDPEFAVGSNLGTSGSRVALTKKADAYGFQTTDGVTTRTKYNDVGQVVELVENWVPTAPNVRTENLTTIYEYYDSTDGVSDLVVGMLESVTSPDPDGPGVGESPYVTTYEYDDTTGLLETITYPDSTTELFEYGTSGGALNLVTQYTDRLGKVVKYFYDSNGNRIREQRVVGTADTLNLVSDPYNLSGDDVVTTWEFGSTGANVDGLPTAMIDARGYRTEYTYTAVGNLEKEKVAVGTSIVASRYFTYNANDQLERAYTELWNPDNFTGYANWAAAKDVNHYYESYVYDALGRMTSKVEIDPDGSGSLTSPTWTYTYDRENRIKTITDPVSRLTTYVYQSNGSYSQELPDHDSNGLNTITTYQVDDRGRVEAMIDPMHYTTSYAYDDLDRLVSTTLPDPDKFFSWSSGSGWTQTSNGSLASPVTKNVYDGLGRVIKAIDPVSHERNVAGSIDEEGDYDDAYGTDYIYSNNGNTVEVRRPSPGGTLDRPVTITERDGNGNVVKVIEGKVAYNASLATTATPLRWTRYVYDDLGRLKEVWKTMPDETSAPTTSNDFRAERYAYDKNGNQTSIETAISITGSYTRTSPQMQTTTFSFDERNRMTAKTEQDPNTSVSGDQPVWGYQYDLQSHLKYQTDPAGKVTDFNYDRLGRQTSMVLPDPDATGPLFRSWYVTGYDAVGRVSKKTDPIGNYTTFFYDALDGNWSQFDKSAADATLTTTRRRYDANQRLMWEFVDGAHTSYEYDALGRVTKVLQPDPDTDATYTTSLSYTDAPGSLPRPFTTYVYDANGNRTSETNELSETTTYGYDYLNRLTSRTDPTIAAGTPVTSYTYDVFGNRLTLNDPEDNTTTWTYDLLNRVKTEMNELDTVVEDGREFTWNVRGDLLVKEDRLDRLVTFTYDLLGRRTLEQWSTVAAPTTFSQYLTYGYDTRGNLTGSESGFTSAFAISAYTYNAANWLTEETLEQSTLLKTKLVTGYDSTSHNSLGLRTLLQASYSTNSGFTTWTNDFQNEYAYDGKNRLATILQKSQTTGNTVANKYVVLGYDEADRVIDIDRYANTTTSNLVAHSDYTLDNLGRPTAIDHLKGGTTFAAYDLTWDARSRLTALDEVFSNSGWNENHDYTYDDTDQLTAADHTVQSDESYTYDENGNRDGSQTRLGNTATWTVDANNRVTYDGTYNYTYDDEGNLTWKYKTGEYIEYVYDHRNRLVRVAFRTASSGTTWQDVFYRYDHANRMIRRLFDADGTAGGGGSTNKFYIHDGNQIVQIFDRPSSTVNLTDRLLWTDQADYLISDERVSTSTVYWSLPNHLGNVVDLATYNSGTDTTTIAKHRGFDSFGNITSDSASGVSIVFGFTGKFLDSTTGLQNNINRWYSAPLGEWMTEDPIGFEGGDENLGRYVGNDPAYATDPTGLAEISVPWWKYWDDHHPLWRQAPEPPDLEGDPAIGLPTDSENTWHPKEFFAKSPYSWEKRKWGCGGMAAFRILGDKGRSPADFYFLPGVKAYSSFEEAVSALNVDEKLGKGRGTLIAIEQTLPFRLDGKDLDGTEHIYGIGTDRIVPPGWGTGNFATLLGNSREYYWEYADNGTNWLTNKSIIIHSKRLAGMKYTLYFVIPGSQTKTSSPYPEYIKFCAAGG